MTAARAGSRKGCARTLAIMAIALSVVVVALIGLSAWLFLGGSSGEAGRPVQVEVPAGASTATIARLLADKDVVANPNMFRIQARMTGSDGKLRPGVYELTSAMAYREVLDRLKQGPPASYVTVTIPEGFVLEQIAARLEKQAGIPAQEFLKLARTGAPSFAQDHPYLSEAYQGSLEGYLFPKTYRIREGASSEQVIEMMLDQFDREMASVDTATATQRGLSATDVVIAASIIERETRVDSERPLVSSVIYNRLARGMNLEIDATIEYVLPGNRFRLRNRDLRIDSPFNTYRFKGLPPGPIANPGLKSLQAAAAPADTDYIYYVLTSKAGTHTFTTNKEDFLRAKQKSKEVFGR